MPLTEGGLILPKDDADIRTWGAVDVGDGFLYYPRRSSVDGGLIIAGAGLAAAAAITNGSAGTRSAYERGINLLLGLIVDQVNGRGRMEINTLHSSEDSITAQGEEVTAYSEVVTSSTAQEVVAAPGSGNYLVVKAFSYQLLEDTDTTAALRDGSGGGDRHTWSLSWDRLSAYGRKISPDGWALTANTALYAKLDVSPTAGVRINVEYVVREV
jgi:hypothetical protein